ncbi:hypothetical protein HAHE_18860 [Haloferula helveola]|uniref:Uncharacterized protein n=1 Tax=Haloferula helveola TaxID=490095 RepID=A0ABN6H7R8_9BACT|nr:hypothetical protein HAHE_18860 [Haloferula helveola]
MSSADSQRMFGRSEAAVVISVVTEANTTASKLLSAGPKRENKDMAKLYDRLAPDFSAWFRGTGSP